MTATNSKSFISYTYATDEYPIALTDKERAFLINNVKDSQRYIEFGAGGSTFLLLSSTDIPEIISVESDGDWLNELRKYPIISDNENKRLKFLHIDIGQTGRWGYPLEKDKKELFPRYSSKVFESCEGFDAVFIDGRFRVACALQTALHCNSKTVVLMHDFPNRREYYCILEFFELMEQVDKMVLLKVKGLSKKKVRGLYEHYKYIAQ